MGGTYAVQCRGRRPLNASCYSARRAAGGTPDLLLLDAQRGWWAIDVQSSEGRGKRRDGERVRFHIQGWADTETPSQRPQLGDHRAPAGRARREPRPVRRARPRRRDRAAGGHGGVRRVYSEEATARAVGIAGRGGGEPRTRLSGGPTTPTSSCAAAPPCGAKARGGCGNPEAAISRAGPPPTAAAPAHTLNDAGVRLARPARARGRGRDVRPHLIEQRRGRSARRATRADVRAEKGTRSPSSAPGSAAPSPPRGRRRRVSRTAAFEPSSALPMYAMPCPPCRTPTLSLSSLSRI